MDNEEQMSFEQAMGRLEQILQQMDHGELPLDDAIRYFQEGLEYIRICQQKLEAAEGKLKILNGDEFEDFTINSEI